MALEIQPKPNAWQANVPMPRHAAPGGVYYVSSYHTYHSYVRMIALHTYHDNCAAHDSFSMDQFFHGPQTKMDNNAIGKQRCHDLSFMMQNAHLSRNYRFMYLKSIKPIAAFPLTALLVELSQFSTLADIFSGLSGGLLV